MSTPAPFDPTRRAVLIGAPCAGAALCLVASGGPLVAHAAALAAVPAVAAAVHPGSPDRRAVLHLSER